MQRALFLGTPFFGYYQHIIAAFRTRGYDVDYFNDRPGENPFLKGAIYVRPQFVDGIIRRYLQTILQQTRANRYNIILVVNGKVFTTQFIVLYLWDPIELYPRVLEFFALFDRRYTFDAADAQAHRDFRLLPLFYTHDYRAVGTAGRQSFDYDIVNVCTAHANRYSLMKSLIPEFSAAGIRVYSYLYLNPLRFAYNKVQSDAFRRARAKEFNFSPLPVVDYVDVLRRSCAVLDVSHAVQSGLTIRTIETLGARRKLITTNSDVRNYPFYDPSRVLVLDAAHLDVEALKLFIGQPQQVLEPAIYRKYGIDCWLEEIISGEGIDR